MAQGTQGGFVLHPHTWFAMSPSKGEMDDDSLLSFPTGYR